LENKKYVQYKELYTVLTKNFDLFNTDEILKVCNTCYYITVYE